MFVSQFNLSLSLSSSPIDIFSFQLFYKAWLWQLIKFFYIVALSYGKHSYWFILLCFYWTYVFGNSHIKIKRLNKKYSALWIKNLNYKLGRHLFHFRKNAFSCLENFLIITFFSYIYTYRDRFLWFYTTTERLR